MRPNLLRLWLFPCEDWDAWLSLVGWSALAGYNSYVAALDERAHEAVGQGLSVEIVRRPVSWMRDQIRKSGVANTPSGRASMIAYPHDPDPGLTIGLKLALTPGGAMQSVGWTALRGPDVLASGTAQTLEEILQQLDAG